MFSDNKNSFVPQTVPQNNFYYFCVATNFEAVMRKKKQTKKQLVHIRYKPLNSGGRSIFLDYSLNGKRNKKYLGLKLIPIQSDIDQLINDEIEKKAEEKRREIEDNIRLKVANLELISEKKNLLDFIKIMQDDYLKKTGTKKGAYYNLKSLYIHLQNYKGNNIIFQDIDKTFVNGFIKYLWDAYSEIQYKNNRKIKLHPNTQHKLFNLLKTVFNRATREEYLKVNPCYQIDMSNKPKTIGTKRGYLEIDEVKLLINTECKNENLKKAFIFSCLTGIRWSDIKRLKYSDIQTDSKGNTGLSYIQQKTKNVSYIEISEEATKWIPIQKDKDTVFILPKNETANKILKEWYSNAGIKKHITFHWSRHTAATLNLTLGVPIEIVSELLGHSKIATTKIYAKIVGEAKREAVNKQNGIFTTEF